MSCARNSSTKTFGARGVPDREKLRRSGMRLAGSATKQGLRLRNADVNYQTSDDEHITRLLPKT